MKYLSFVFISITFWSCNQDTEDTPPEVPDSQSQYQATTDTGAAADSSASTAHPYCRVLNNNQQYWLIKCSSNQDQEETALKWDYQVLEGSQDTISIVETIEANDTEWDFGLEIETEASWSELNERLVIAIEQDLDLSDSFSLEHLTNRDPLKGQAAPAHYKLVFDAVSSPCDEKSVALLGLEVSWDGESKLDTFQDIPETSDPQANVGFIGEQAVVLTSSGSAIGYLEFEAFGGGYGNGWWSNAIGDSSGWFQISFLEEAQWIDRLQFVARPEGCAPEIFSLQISYDEDHWQTVHQNERKFTDEYQIVLSYK